MGDFKRPKFYTDGEHKRTLAQLCERLHAGHITLVNLCKCVGINCKLVSEAANRWMRMGYSKKEAIEKAIEEEIEKESKRRPIDPPDTGPISPCPEYE